MCVWIARLLLAWANNDDPNRCARSCLPLLLMLDVGTRVAGPPAHLACADLWSSSGVGQLRGWPTPVMATTAVRVTVHCEDSFDGYM